MNCINLSCIGVSIYCMPSEWRISISFSARIFAVLLPPSSFFDSSRIFCITSVISPLLFRAAIKCASALPLDTNARIMSLEAPATFSRFRSCLRAEVSASVVRYKSVSSWSICFLAFDASFGSSAYLPPIDASALIIVFNLRNALHGASVTPLAWVCLAEASVLHPALGYFSFSSFSIDLALYVAVPRLSENSTM